MYTRSNYEKRQNGIAIPFNYSGNAFINTSHEPETKVHTSKATVMPRRSYPHEENEHEEGQPLNENEINDIISDYPDKKSHEDASVSVAQTKKGGFGDLSGSLGKLIGSIGSEELLLLALLLITSSANNGEGNDELSLILLLLLLLK